ncbi:hypothetical protein D0Z00_003033 [Geotrichum galactomycetum]|uniref:Uncharacterized protein n=1 Tax=Geotrichum galactomycetum TaxID=27317 RepID=A0ACB6V2I4_9ASCO|nr:hypothetical protein D0Z00_003033 [Geotrichum candidum]
MDNSQFTASNFDVMFYRSNNSLSFEVSAISTLSGEFKARINVIAYGFNAVTESVDLCSISQQLCPMTPGHFDVPLSAQTISEDIISSIPGIAFSIPDLDGVVRVMVYSKNDTSFSTPVACVEATLSNGKTVSTKYAAWPIAAICFAGLFTAGIVWLYGHISTSAHIASNIVSLFVYFQGVAIIVMMAVDKLPPVAAAWGQNFMWTMGLISVPFMQDIFNWYVQATGGHVTNILPNAQIMSISVQKVKRAFSDVDFTSIARYFTPLTSNGPINSVVTSNTVKAVSEYASDEAMPRNVAMFMSHKALLAANAMGHLVKRANDTISTAETTNEDLDDYSATTLVLRGIQRVAYLANIEITSVFLTGFTFFLIICVAAMIFAIIMKLFVELLVKVNAINPTTFLEYRNGWLTVTKGVLYRLTLLGFPQLSVLCLWELTKHDSPATVVLAVVSYFVVVSLLAFGAYKTISIARRSMRDYKNPAFILYSDANALNRLGFLYVQFRATAYFYIAPLLIYLFVKCAIIAFGQGAGKVQAVLIFVLELAYLVVISIYKPYMDKATNGFNIGISAINFINSLLFLFFSAIFGVPAYVAGVMGVVFFILNAVFSLVLLIMILVSCIWAVFAKNPETRYQPMTDDRESFIPNPEGEKNKATELDALGLSARDGYHPSSQEMYGSSRAGLQTFEDDDDDLNSPYRRDSTPGFMNNDPSAASLTTNSAATRSDTNLISGETNRYPNERLTRNGDMSGTSVNNPYANNSNTNSRSYIEPESPISTGFPQTSYAGYQPTANSDVTENYRGRW